MNSQGSQPSSGCVFDLHLVAGGYAYYSTVSKWIGSGEHGRDIRGPEAAVNIAKFERALVALGRHAFFIRTQDDYEYWLYRRGWAFVPKDVAYSVMPQWLSEHECVIDAADTYTDIEIASDGVLAHRVGSGKRKTVHERDSGRCLLCGRTQGDGAEITMHHVTPHSRGGETTSRNIVCLCKDCNQRVSNEKLSQLYELAGLPHSYDLGLLNAENTEEALTWALIISNHLMRSRCDVY